MCIKVSNFCTKNCGVSSMVSCLGFGVVVSEFGVLGGGSMKFTAVSG